jgi:hypothetical protein
MSVKSKVLPGTRNILQAERKWYQLGIWIYKRLKSVRMANMQANTQHIFLILISLSDD